MLHLIIGSRYEFTLASGRTVIIVVYGSKPDPASGTLWDISVDRKRAFYTDINQALGEPFTKVALVP